MLCGVPHHRFKHLRRTYPVFGVGCRDDTRVNKCPDRIGLVQPAIHFDFARVRVGDASSRNHSFHSLHRAQQQCRSLRLKEFVGKIRISLVGWDDDSESE